VGANGPLVLAVDVEDDPAVVDRLSTAVADTEGVAAVLPARLNETGDTAALFVVPATGPQDRRTQDLIHRLRNDVVPEVAAASEADVYVGGANAAFVDESEFMAGRLPWFIGAVIALSFLLLLTVFRSVLVAVKAALMNLLAIGAAYGVMAVALQGGRLGGLLGIHEPTPVPAWTPMMMFALFRAVDGLRGVSGFRKLHSATAWPHRQTPPAPLWRPVLVKVIGTCYGGAARHGRMVWCPWSSSATATGGCRAGSTVCCPGSTSRAVATRPPRLPVRPSSDRPSPDRSSPASGSR
jgi:hypothetical protein